jgi:hypothetical protein
MTSGPEGHFVPEIQSQDRTKGQPEGSAVTGKTRKPRVANHGLVSGNAAGHNNSNLAPSAASVANGEWELLLGMVPIIVLYNFTPVNMLICLIPDLKISSLSLMAKENSTASKHLLIRYLK